ncbi:MAG: Wzz/FepE/Etk N-terminal domain-containing protein [Bacteroidota bacterium]
MNTQQDSVDNLTPHSEEPALSLSDVVSPIWQHRRRVLIISFAAAVLALGINFILPAYFKSTAKILPETEKNKLSALSQFADVAQLAGVSMPGSEIARLYPLIMSSETVLRIVIDRRYQTAKFPQPVTLIEFFELDEETPEENAAEAVKEMQELLVTTYEVKTGLVTVTLEMREPRLAADVLNALIDELDKFMRLKRVSNATEQRKWVDVRLTQVEEELRHAENALLAFREKNRRVIDSPQLLVEQERKMREVQVKSTVYIELVKQSELAKIEEIKNIAIVNVLDPARPAVKKERPRRLINTLIVFFVTLVAMCVFVVVQSKYATQWMAITQSLVRRSEHAPTQ